MIRAMTCRDAISRLMDYIDGRLTASERRAVEAHLIVCVRCRELLESYRKTPEIFKRATSARLPRTAARRLHSALKKKTE